jgi:chromatin segregation and condensation protein Rec8/ScpA/Scc1 (kleisin family)
MRLKPLKEAARMQDYRVELDVYHGPLDLLLYLIKRDEIDINDIPIAPITEQYLAYLQTIKRLDINLAGEFLVMAATLMEIKSAMMMPREAGEEGEETDLTAAEDPTDPRYELIQQLLAYKRFKDARANWTNAAKNLPPASPAPRANCLPTMTSRSNWTSTTCRCGTWSKRSGG